MARTSLWTSKRSQPSFVDLRLGVGDRFYH